MKIRVIVKKEANDGIFGARVDLDIATQMQLEELVSNFLSADFNKREEILKIK